MVGVVQIDSDRLVNDFDEVTALKSFFMEIRMNKKYYIIGGLVLLALVFEAGRFTKPAEIKIQTKEVVKTVKEEAKTKIVYKEKIVYKDGTVIERETDTEHSNTKESNESTKQASSETKRDVGLTLSALAIVDSSNIKGHQDYGIHVTKRVFSNVVVGGFASTDKKIGVSVGLEF